MLRKSEDLWKGLLSRNPKLFREGERVLWAGRPGRASCTFWERSRDERCTGLALLSCLIFGLAVLGAGPSGLFFGAPVLLFGVAPFFWFVARKTWRLRQTFYFVTDQRVLKVVDFFPRALESLEIRELPHLHKSVDLDGSGTVLFGYGLKEEEFSCRSAGKRLDSFIAIPDVVAVCNLILGLKVLAERRATEVASENPTRVGS